MSRRAAAAALALLLTALMGAGGCAPCPGTLVSLPELVAEYNGNAAKVPRLWARARIAVTLVPGDGEGEFTWGSASAAATPNGLLLLAKGPGGGGPYDFVLIGRETAAIELFRLGTSAEEGLYYFWYHFGDRGGAWFGHTRYAGAAGVRELPIDPMQLLSVLGITPLPPDATDVPLVAVSMQNTPGDCAYVVTYLARQPVSRRILFQREMFFRWSDSEPRRPYKVNFLDALGRRVMTARLRGYRPIDVADLDEPPNPPPVMPTDIEIAANPQPGVATFVKRIHLVLSEMTAADKWDRAATAFRPPPGVAPVQVDKDVGAPPPARGEEGGRP